MKSEDPEVLETLRMQYLRGYILGAFAFLLLWFTRFFFRAGDLNSKPVGIAVLGGLILTALVYAYFMLRLSALNARICSDPEVNAAVNNELFLNCAMRAWKPAFIGSVGSTLLLALIAFAYPVIDLMFVALTAIVVGAFTYLASLYWMFRTS